MIKVLLLTAEFGDGHLQAARALQESFENRGAEVAQADCFKQTNIWTAMASKKLYELTTRYVPQVYGAIHKATANLPSTHVLWKFLSLFSKSALIRTIEEYKPDVVLQLFPDHGAEVLSKKGIIPYLGVVVTDFSVHGHWLHRGADVYFVANPKLRQPMRPFLDSHSGIVAAGIPIKRQFSEPSGEEIVNHHNIPSTPYVLILTGGRGVFPQLNQVIQSTLDALPDMQVFVLCGRNQSMLKQMTSWSKSEPRLQGLPYIQDVAQWFRNAAFALVKSGGITVSECLACDCPMVFYRPQPGQEMDNATFLESAGAGIVANTVDELQAFLAQPNIQQTLSGMRDATRGLSRPHAADTIADYVIRELGTHIGVKCITTGAESVKRRFRSSWKGIVAAYARRNFRHSSYISHR